jgi:hypothetical protein
MRILLVALVCAAGCAETAPCGEMQCSLVAYPTAPAPAPQPAYQPPPWSHVVVMQSTHTDRLTEVVGVIDIHSAQGGEEWALEAVRQRAAQMGADAVLGVEFHHGEAHPGEPTHLSGLAVRFLPALPY